MPRLREVFRHAVRGFTLYRDAELGRCRAGCARAPIRLLPALQAAALGLGEDKIRDISHWRTSEHYDEAERPVLACTDGLVLAGGRVPDGTFEALRRHSSDAEILQLTYIACTYEIRATNSRALRPEFDDREEPVVEVEVLGDAASGTPPRTSPAEGRTARSTVATMNDSAQLLADQIVVVTGGGRGLGHALVRAFAGEGAHVVVNYRRSRAQAEALAERIGAERAIVIDADVTDQQQVDRLFAAAREHFGRPVTTVVNNALADFSFNGDARSGVDRISWGEFSAQFEGTVRAALTTTQAALPGLRERGGGHIINIGTNLFQNPVVPYHDYTAAKAALLSLTRTLAADLGPEGITVNMVSGGLLRTTDASAATPDAVFDGVAAATPLRRVVTPEEFADAVLFFASPWARSVTGQNLIVDGGLVNG